MTRFFSHTRHTVMISAVQDILQDIRWSWWYRSSSITIRKKSDTFLWEHIYPSFHGNYATNYSKENEVRACLQLKEQGMNITHKGTVVSVQEPWLSASPAGVIDTCVLLEKKKKKMSCANPALTHWAANSEMQWYQTSRWRVAAAENWQ